MGEQPGAVDDVMLRAVNRDLEELPQLAGTALAELARSLARRVDAGELRAAAELRRTLVELGRLARAKPKPSTSDVGSAGQEVATDGDDDPLDAIQADRAARRDDLAPRRARRSGAADHDGAAAGSGSAGDVGG